VRPPQAVLDSLKLRYGRNDVAFTVTSALQGEKTVRASLYLWDWRTKIVISDIDGTITRSDVFGHVLPTLGRDWSHAGVARLFSNIKRNGYEMLYLTSRPVGSAKRTRGYIASVTQDNISLPEGPMLMSPERLLTALQVEVVARRPDIFKTQCLGDVRRLFPENTAPFYSGFGNRPTDAIAYRAIGIARHKIFIIDPKGDIRTDNQTYVKSYTTLNELVDDAFPAITREKVPPAVEDDFNSFQYWRTPIPTAKLPPLK
jgi:phosphatidate phosphatase LPIN